MLWLIRRFHIAPPLVLAHAFYRFVAMRAAADERFAIPIGTATERFVPVEQTKKLREHPSPFPTDVHGRIAPVAMFCCSAE